MSGTISVSFTAHSFFNVEFFNHFDFFSHCTMTIVSQSYMRIRKVLLQSAPALEWKYPVLLGDRYVLIPANI